MWGTSFETLNELETRLRAYFWSCAFQCGLIIHFANRRPLRQSLFIVRALCLFSKEGATVDYCQLIDGQSFAHYRQPHHYSRRRWCRDGQCCLLCWVQCSHHWAYFAYCLINIAKMSYKEAYFEVQIGLMNGQTNDVILPFRDLFTLERRKKSLQTCECLCWERQL